MSSQFFPSEGPQRWRYDVFLSFNGPDTRRTFTDHLYHALMDKGVNVFMDNEQLQRGEDISTGIIEAIRSSKISVIVFSINYANSRWCLHELAEIMECKKKNSGQSVFPVFYGVKPSDVRQQRGSFAETILEHESKLDFMSDEVKITIARWNTALKEAASLSGWDLATRFDGVAKVIEDIVDVIWNELIHTSRYVAEYSVGIDYQVKDILAQLNACLNGALRFVGICGMGGIGKTTLAKAVFNQFLHTFEAKSFLSSVREQSEQPNGLVHLQEHLLRDLLKVNHKILLLDIDSGINVIKERLRNTRVLIVLDDISELYQLWALAGERTWFGMGSLIIITTRNEALLKEIQVDYTFMVQELDVDESLKLFNLHAFGNCDSKEEFIDISKAIVTYCGGLPLAVKVLGSFLRDRSIREWKSAFEKWKRIPHHDVQKQLQLSYDALHYNEKEIFLHIASFFAGGYKDYVISILNGCDLLGEFGINELTNRCLLKVERGRLVMHDLIRDMGREIVRRESPNEPGNRSRLWYYDDIMSTLQNQSGTSKVEGLVLDPPMLQEVEGGLVVDPPMLQEIGALELARMNRLKLLRLNNVHIPANYGLLSKELRWICWHKFPLSFIPEDFYMGNVVSFDMQYSKLQTAWIDTKILINLKFLNLSHSHSLYGTPKFSELPFLEKLVLDDCKELIEVHPSIVCLQKLVLLSLKDCKSLQSLPKRICSVRSLQILDISGCSKIKRLPDDLGKMEALVKFLAQGTAIRKLPLSFVHLKNLKEWSLPDHKASPSITSRVRLKGTSSSGSVVTATEIKQAGSIPKRQIYDNQAGPSNSLLGEGHQTKRMRHMDKISAPDAMPGKVLLILGCDGSSSVDRFVSHLSSTLMAAGISTVNTTRLMAEDVEELIENSELCMPIFTNDENTLISWGHSNIKYMVEFGQHSPEKMILPVFYGIEPSQILQRFGNWIAPIAVMKALSDAANTSGWVVKKPSCGKVVSLIVREVSNILGYTHLGMASHIVGIDRKVEFMMNLLDIEVTDRRIVGICGMGGIGKTILAKAVHRRISASFEGSCFLQDIGETIKRRHDALQFLQTKLISDILKRECEKVDSIDEGISFLKEMLCEMRVLVVLDDVHLGFNLEELVGKLDSFGPGSRIIITTRCNDNLPIGAATYDIPKMSKWEVLNHFKKYVPNDNIAPDADYRKLKQDIASTIGGLPLAVEVIGSFLSHKSISVWKDTVGKLRKLPEREIYKNLMISFESLKLQQKQIFMDIACFADREDNRITSYLWHYPTQAEGLKRLLDMSLVKIGENKELLMHSELREIGRQLLFQEIKRNEGIEVEDMYRPWVQEANFETVLSKKGIENVEALRLCFDDRSEYQDIELRMMPNIRYLRLDRANIVGDFKDMFLNLMWLHWEGCPGNFRASNLHLKSLVILNLSRSGITESWSGWSQLKMSIELKVLDLTGCAELTITPDFSGFPNLERLILEHCCALAKLDSSICSLKKLRSLNLRFCTELSALPEELGLLKALEELLIDGTPIREIPASLGHIENIETLSALVCSSLTRLPPSLGYLKSLVVLSLGHTKINELPSSITGLVKLQRLSVRDCQLLSELPRSIGELSDSLLELDVSRTGISNLPNSIGNLLRLRVLKTEYCFIEEFPSAILGLSNLEEIHASYCRSLKQFIPSETVPSEHGKKLHSLKLLRLKYSGISNLPSDFCYLVSNLLTLDLLHCDMLMALPELPSSLTSLHFSCNEVEKLPVLHDLPHLEELILADCDFEELMHQEASFKEASYQRIPSGDFNECLVLSDMTMLKRLELYLSRIRTIQLPSSNWHTSMRKLVVHCPDLKSVPCFPATLLNLQIRHCWSLETLEVGEMKALSELQLHDSGVGEIKGLRILKALQILRISNCKVEHLEGLEELESLKSLIVSNCDHLREMPELSNLKVLRELEVQCCMNGDNIKGITDLTTGKAAFS